MKMLEYFKKDLIIGMKEGRRKSSADYRYAVIGFFITAIVVIALIYVSHGLAYTVKTEYVYNTPFTQYGESYNVMVYPDIDMSQVQVKLSQFHKYYHFTVIPYDKRRTYYNYFKGIYMPKDEWTILITPDNFKGVVGREEGTGIGIEVSTQMDFNSLLQHELNHVYYGCLADTTGFNPNLDEIYYRWMNPNRTIINRITA